MQKEYYSITMLPKILQANKHIFLVTGKDSYEQCGAKLIFDHLEQLFLQEIIHFSDFETNPKDGDVKKGAKLFNKKIDAIVAIGGGSVIDMAKLIKHEAKANVPLIAIPTTAGTGSEATHFATVYINGEKHSIEDVSIKPDCVMLEPVLTYSMSPRLTAITGMDALSHAIESFWAKGATGESEVYSRLAIKYIYNNLGRAVYGDKKARMMMFLASNFAGKAIDIARTTACHAISYTITSKFGIPHGHAVALTLPQMISFNDNKEVVECLGAKNVRDASLGVKKLMIDVGLETSLKSLGISDINSIVAGINQERLKNNPRQLTKNNIRSILNK